MHLVLSLLEHSILEIFLLFVKIRTTDAVTSIPLVRMLCASFADREIYVEWYGLTLNNSESVHVLYL